MLSVLGARPSVLSSPVATLARGDCRSTSTPPATFIGDYRSTPAPLTAPIGCVDAYDSIDPRLPLALGLVGMCPRLLHRPLRMMLVMLCRLLWRLPQVVVGLVAAPLPVLLRRLLQLCTSPSRRLWDSVVC